MEGFSMFRRAVDLFTPDEHTVLARWFNIEPPDSAKDIEPEEAASRLGFNKHPDFYLLEDAVVAFIVLEQVELRLPQWSAVLYDGTFVVARPLRDRSAIPYRKVVIQPRHLLTINWADSGPGFSWPMAYYVTWLPYYDRFVVTASSDCTEVFGYCDFALGSFAKDTTLKKGAGKIICDDWTTLCNQRGKTRWEYLFRVGLTSKEDAHAWAAEVWPSEQPAEEFEPFLNRRR
jgi:hypothetical protein